MVYKLIQFMIRLALLILFLVTYSLTFAHTPSDSTAFDFWIGNWDVHWYNSDSSKGKGTNEIHHILDGSVLQENFIVIDDPNMKGYTGKSWTVFNKRDLTWHQTWVDNQGGYIEFEGITEKDRKIFRTGIKAVDDKRYVSQMIFYNISEEGFTWDWMRSENGGEDWKLLWRIYYNRKD
jgi:hypothetical protein